MSPGSKGLPEEFIMKGLILIFLLAASEVYRFIDKILEHTPNQYEIE